MKRLAMRVWRVLRNCTRGDHLIAVESERHVAQVRDGWGEVHVDAWTALVARCVDCGDHKQLGRVSALGSNRRAGHPWKADDQ